VAAALPIGIYVVGYHHQHGQYAVTSTGPRFLYSRVAPIVRCDDPALALPRYERILCPAQPVGQRPDSNSFMWSRGRGPAFRVHPPPGMTRSQVLTDFDQRVIRAQPLAYTKEVLADFVRGFAPSRTTQVPGYPSSYWLFADHYWSWDTFGARGSLSQLIGRVDSDRPAAEFMTAYRTWVYLPGPIAALLLVVAAAATLGVGRARACGDRVMIGLLAGACLLTLLTGAALSGFSWRYQLPQIPLLPMAGALAIAALVRGRADGRPARPVGALDRSTRALTRLPMPASWRLGLHRAAASGRAQPVVAVLAGLLAAGVVAAAAVASGWFVPRSGLVLGAVIGVLVVVALLVSHRRAVQHGAIDGRPLT
jgi:hypothetical protein